MIKTRTPEELAKLNLPTFESLMDQSRKVDEDIKKIDEKIKWCKETPMFFFDAMELNILITIREDLVEEQKSLQYKYDLMSKAYLDGANAAKVSFMKADPTEPEENKEPEHKQDNADPKLYGGDTISITMCEEALDKIKNSKTLADLKAALVDAFE